MPNKASFKIFYKEKELYRQLVTTACIALLAQLSHADPLANMNAGMAFRDCPECPEMVVLPSGNFEMGSPPDEPGRSQTSWNPDRESPVHPVSIRAFAIGKFEVTRSQFQAFITATRRQVSIDGKWAQPYRFNQDDTHPVVDVTWDEAKAYVAWLSLKTKHTYRLPSESEWEYAARAGTTSAQYWGSDLDEACIYENIADETAKQDPKEAERWKGHKRVTASCSDGFVFTSPVGSFKPNPFGLYDMLGNASEWVEDCAHLANYNNAPSDGSAWHTGASPPLIRGSDTVETASNKVLSSENCEMRMSRGGSWYFGFARVAFRGAHGKWERSDEQGFRVAMTLQYPE